MRAWSAGWPTCSRPPQSLFEILEYQSRSISFLQDIRNGNAHATCSRRFRSQMSQFPSDSIDTEG